MALLIHFEQIGYWRCDCFRWYCIWRQMTSQCIARKECIIKDNDVTKSGHIVSI